MRHSGNRVRATLLSLILFALPASGTAQIWNDVIQDMDGRPLDAAGVDLDGRAVRLAWGYTEDGVTVLFQKDGRSLTVLSRAAAQMVSLDWAEGPDRLKAVLDQDGSMLSLSLPRGQEIRIDLADASSAVAGSLEAAIALDVDTPFLEFGRDYLAALRSLPVEPPITADVLMEPLLFPASAGGGLVPIEGPALGECWRECVDGCPRDCAWACSSRFTREACLICMASCNLGCGIGCGCFACFRLGARLEGGPSAPDDVFLPSGR